MRYLSIDLGDKRTGLAVADHPGGIAAPLEVIEQPFGEALLEALLRAIAEQKPQELVVGLPLNMVEQARDDDAEDADDDADDAGRAGDGESGGASSREQPRAKLAANAGQKGGKGKPSNTAADRVRAFGARLSERAGLPVHFQDERLTSVQADWDMARSGLTHKGKKKRRDALAALVILEDFLRSLK